ncbi:MAG: hypothetical protein K2Y20_04765 [Sphingomonas sp.]|nr:hypothetical protein [Sphingomonas sp.]
MQRSDYEAKTKAVAEREFGAVNVITVIAHRNLDEDGDPIWRVVVVLGDPQIVAPSKMSGFVRHLRVALPDEPFPIVSFRSHRDNLESSPEAA